MPFVAYWRSNFGTTKSDTLRETNYILKMCDTKFLKLNPLKGRANCIIKDSYNKTAFGSLCVLITLEFVELDSLISSLCKQFYSVCIFLSASEDVFTLATIDIRDFILEIGSLWVLGRWDTAHTAWILILLDHIASASSKYNYNYSFISVYPVIQVPNQLVGAPLGTDVTLECNVEASPKSINYWLRDTGMYNLNKLLKLLCVNYLLNISDVAYVLFMYS